MAELVKVVEHNDQDGDPSQMFSVVSGEDNGQADRHCKKLLTTQLQPQLYNIPEHERTQLITLLAECNTAFSLQDGERGETTLATMNIDTGDATQKKHPVRRVPFALRQEVVKQLEKMQEEGVIQPLSSPWASAIVLVRKKDGSLRICIDYRHLNSVTKPDTFPLPRIDDKMPSISLR